MKTKVLSFLRAFFLTMLIFLCIGTLLLGFATADYKTDDSKTVFDNDGFAVRKSENNIDFSFLGLKYNLNINPILDAADNIKKLDFLIPPGIRVFYKLIMG